MILVEIVHIEIFSNFATVSFLRKQDGESNHTDLLSVHSILANFPPFDSISHEAQYFRSYL